MMGNFYGSMMGGYFGFGAIFGLVTWIALLSFLIFGSIHFWQEINRKKR